jgi:hypothetical protein
MSRASKSFQKFKIASLEAELELTKLQLKSQTHTSLNRSYLGQNKANLYIHFLESTYKMTSFSSGKKCSEVCEADNQQINGHVFAMNGLLPYLVPFPPPPHCHPTPWMWVEMRRP